MVGRLTGRLRGAGGAAPAAVICHASSPSRSPARCRCAPRAERAKIFADSCVLNGTGPGP
eukprot:3888199-Prymnesium_polylepis.1